MKGTYILLMYLDNNKKIKIGKNINIKFKKGWYIYIGSALNSLKPRIIRHYQSTKKFHWHIDYFLKHAQIKKVYIKQGTIKEECLVASKFFKNFLAIPKFGCSDCFCKTHLFTGDKENLFQIIKKSQFTEIYL
jgi:Uri superfamily endonuclease